MSKPPSKDTVFSLLRRFQMIRHVSRCFEYMVESRAQWGPGIRERRNLLAARLTPAQQADYKDAFSLMDNNGDGTVSLLELKRVMESIGESKPDDELSAMIQSVNMDGSLLLGEQDFMGIMAEADLYDLFRETFASLDTDNTGFVKAGELDRVLCGVRDLISDDRKSIIDVEDKEMLIDYEQFSRMMLGTTLI
jgi:Ca2+-binding EF-hand superfamily protein